MKFEHVKRGKERNAKLWFGGPWDRNRLEFSFERFSLWLMASIDTRDDTRIGLCLFGVYLSLHMRWLGKRFGYDYNREVGFYLYNDDYSVFGIWDLALSISLGRDPMGDWPNKHGYHWYLHPLRWIVGDTKYEERVLMTAPIAVLMPEGPYPGTWTEMRVRWQRPRWFKQTWHYRYTIDMQRGIPIPGKGENSWDCDEDATHGITFAVQDEPESMGETATRLMLDCMKTRTQRGGANWRPALRVEDEVTNG